MEKYLNPHKLSLLMELDSFDKKILFVLDQNARTSYVQIAKQTHLSKVMVLL